jgi:radical SAM protein with 4Fe4S-binding SPASM domain
MEKSSLRFEIRLEFFGSLAWDFKTGEWVAFDSESTQMLMGISKNNKLLDKLKKEKKNFISLLEKKELLIHNTPNYYFLKDRSKDSKILSAPMRLHYAITAKCNLKCKHCFTRNILKSEPKELSFDNKLDVLDQMVDLGIREMLVSGGEPFLYPKFIDFLKEACKRRINIKVFSNGFLLNQNIIGKVKNVPIDYLAISVDGATEYSFKKVRGAQDFNKLKNIIKSLSEQCVFPIVMQITVSRINYGDLENYFEIAIGSGVKRIKIRALKPGGTILENAEMMISFEEYLTFCKEAEKRFKERDYKKKYGFNLDCTLGNIRMVYEDGKLLLENIPQPYEGFGCVGGKITLFLDAFGNVHPCAFIDNFLDKNLADNIKEKPLKKIWDSNVNICKMRDLRGNPRCLSCELYNLCRGGCKARSVYYHNTNDLNLPDGWCPRDVGLKIKK